jgi:zinc/manganese transport system substrate-binding protein
VLTVSLSLRASRCRYVSSLLVVGLGSVLAGCGASSALDVARPGTILAVGAENEYANVIAQIGGRYVTASAVESNPNTDPHSFEASPSVARAVSAAALVVQNGLGYDSYMNSIEAAAANAKRRVIDVQRLLGLPDSTSNPHLWYSPRTMPTLAREIASDLAALEPRHAAYFASQARRFEASLGAWRAALAAFRARYPRTAVATTEPVADYMLAAAGTINRTPFTLQADIMNGVDPAPQDVTAQMELLAHHRVQVFVYNQQVTDPLTASFLAAAKAGHVPVVGVYETMPTPGFDYQTWMLAEVEALRRAVASGESTTRLR